RRHTRFSRDWSSDVCSSDLVIHQRALVFQQLQRHIIRVLRLLAFASELDHKLAFGETVGTVGTGFVDGMNGALHLEVLGHERVLSIAGIKRSADGITKRLWRDALMPC